MSKLEKIFKQSYILASKSPRRIQLLNQIGLKFISIDSKIQELDYENYNPIQLVKYNSLSKSRKVALNYDKEIVIGADTVVVLNQKILNKPKDINHAIILLKKLSNKKHFVYTGLNLINTKNSKELFGYEKTTVYFRMLGEDEIKYYIKKYKPMDKAGAYGIQDDFGCLFIKKIVGDYYNIIGLPLCQLYVNLGKIL